MRFVALVLAFSILGSFAQPAQAVTIGGEVYGSFNTYAMDDWNDLFDEANQLGADFDEISSGISGGIGGRLWASPNVLIAVAWEPLFASTEDAGVEAKLDGNAFVGTLAYMIPVGTNARYGVGAGGGFYSLNGEIAETGEDTIELTGSTVGFHILGLAEWIVSPGFGITAGAGYRGAKITDTEADGQSQIPEFETDYSGITGRVGVVFYLPNGN
jgi:hypothetical protein